MKSTTEMATLNGMPGRAVVTGDISGFEPQKPFGVVSSHGTAETISCDDSSQITSHAQNPENFSPILSDEQIDAYFEVMKSGTADLDAEIKKIAAGQFKIGNQVERAENKVDGIQGHVVKLDKSPQVIGRSVQDTNTKANNAGEAWIRDKLDGHLNSLPNQLEFVTELSLIGAKASMESLDAISEFRGETTPLLHELNENIDLILNKDKAVTDLREARRQLKQMTQEKNELRAALERMTKEYESLREEQHASSANSCRENNSRHSGSNLPTLRVHSKSLSKSAAHKYGKKKKGANSSGLPASKRTQ